MALKRILLLLMVLNFLVSSCCFAEDFVGIDKYEQLEKRVKALEEKLIEQNNYIRSQNKTIQAQQQKITEYESKLSQFDEELHREEGALAKVVESLEIGASATMIVQGTNNVSAGDNTKKDSRIDGSYSADITISKEFKDLGGRTFLHLEAGTGAGLEDDLSLYSNVNRDADNDNNIRVTELWYEQGLFKDKVAVTFGKLDPTVYFDNNEVANDETTQFLGRIFRNSPTIEFPDNTAGVRIAYLPSEWLELGYGVFDGNNDWEKIGDNLFNIGQVTLKTHFFNLPGNYRFLGWNSNSYHTKWLDSEKQKENNYGFGLSFDQKAHELVTLFTRYGWQDPEVYNPDIKATDDLDYSLEHSWSAGFQIEGKPWGREKDILAFAVGQAIPSDDYKKAGAELDPARRAKNEGHLEAYYNIHVNDHLSISPDLQYIWNPFGKDVTDDTSSIFVYGARAQVDF
ncbi:MAG: hypothetical protein AMJ78_03920 [Omnitrophica WOR_2 bacterium SM23_29]|nr:MAG: hypothetical protein AMJ78_03920 [Omnitrophica WOR_2 bacterium SM23_29]